MLILSPAFLSLFQFTLFVQTLEGVSLPNLTQVSPGCSLPNTSIYYEGLPLAGNNTVGLYEASSLGAEAEDKPETKVWTESIIKGTRLFNQLQSGFHPDIIDPFTTAELRELGWVITPWPLSAQNRSEARLLDEPLDMIGASKSKDYYPTVAQNGGKTHGLQSWMSFVSLKSL